jgi:hypothetical protein
MKSGSSPPWVDSHELYGAEMLPHEREDGFLVLEKLVLMLHFYEKSVTLPVPFVHKKVGVPTTTVAAFLQLLSFCFPIKFF